MKQTIPVVLLLIGCSLQLRADELRLTAEEALRRGSLHWVKPAADGKSIELTRGLLYEHDGAAAGFSYLPNEEILQEGLRAFQTFDLELPAQPIFPARALLLVGHSGKNLQALINGQGVKLTAAGSAGNYWKQYEIPPTALQNGKNEIGISGEGKLWIAREDERLAGRKPPDKGPHSYKRTGGGEPTKLLGPKNDIAGEYYLRLYLDGFRERGFWETPTLDAANLSGTSIPPPNVRVKRIQVFVVGDPVGGELSGSITWATKPDRSIIEVRTSQDGDFDSDSHSDSPPRFFEAAAWLRRGTSFEATPKLHEVRVKSEVTADKGWGEKLKVLTLHDPPLREWDNGSFHFEKFDHPKLAQFRRDFHLDDVVKGCQTDLERMQKLAVWTSQQWAKGHLGEIYPKWDACEILKKHADGTPIGGFCQQYNIVFLQACEAFGMPGRCVSIGAGDHGVKIRSGHEVVEIWSNELNKWVYVDGQAAWYFVDKETREPLNLLELRERQLAALLDKPLRAESKRPVEVVVLAKSPYEWKGLTEWPAFTELRMIPHTKFLDGKLPLPLNQGMRGWFWTGHRVWTDDLYPASVLYGNRLTNANDWNFPINQTKIWLQQNAKLGDLDVRCEHNMPSFARYEVQFDDQPARFEEQAEFPWPLHPGRNRLQVRAVNQLGLRGPPSWYEAEYK